MKRSRPYAISSRRRTKSPRLTMAQTAAVRAEINREIAKRTDYKCCDLSSTTTTLSQSGAVQDLLQNIAIGDLALNDYEGDTIFPKYIRIKLTAINASSTLFHSARIIIGQSLTEFIPPATELLQVTGTNQVCVSAPNFSFSRNHKILYDQTHTLQAQGGTSAKDVNIFISGKRLRKVQFSATTSGSITRYPLFLAAFTSDNMTDVSLRFFSRVVFAD